MKTRRSGFTLVEILIVVVILGILAAIIIPQFSNASNEARQSTLESNLQMLQSQFELYKVQHLDVYPWDDPATTDADLDGNAAILARLVNKTLENGTVDNVNGTCGPYMQEVPVNPFVSGDHDAVFAGTAAANVDWAINTATGAITDGVLVEEED